MKKKTIFQRILPEKTSNLKMQKTSITKEIQKCAQNQRNTSQSLQSQLALTKQT
jgi:hypothetical protein